MHPKPLGLKHVNQRISREILLCSDFAPDGKTLVEITAIKPSSQLLELPLMGVPIQAGFPSPADDYVEQSLDINQFMIKPQLKLLLVLQSL